LSSLHRPFFKKSETFSCPENAHVRQANTLLHDPQSLGTAGPIKASFAAEYSSSHAHWHKTLNALGIETNAAHVAGSNIGVWTNLGAVDPRNKTRSYAANAYYDAKAARPNLVLLTEATVEEIILEQDDDQWAARGVRFTHGDELYEVRTTLEVILSAGSVQSPQLLELSGVGPPDVLKKAGVEVKVPSRNVGENLQDHISTWLALLPS